MSGKIIAWGAVFERAISSGGTFERVPNSKGVAVPKVTTDYIDVTDLDSADGYKEYLPALKDGGLITVPHNYTADAFELHFVDQASELLIYYRTTLKAQTGQASGDVITFQGFPTPGLETTEVDGVLMFDVEIRTSGLLTWTRGAAVV